MYVMVMTATNSEIRLEATDTETQPLDVTAAAATGESADRHRQHTPNALM